MGYPYEEFNVDNYVEDDYEDLEAVASITIRELLSLMKQWGTFYIIVYDISPKPPSLLYKKLDRLSRYHPLYRLQKSVLITPKEDVVDRVLSIIHYIANLKRLRVNVAVFKATAVEEYY